MVRNNGVLTKLRLRQNGAIGNTEPCSKHDMECAILSARELPLPLRHTGLLASLQHGLNIEKLPRSAS